MIFFLIFLKFNSKNVLQGGGKSGGEFFKGARGGGFGVGRFKRGADSEHNPKFRVLEKKLKRFCSRFF